MTYDDRDRRDWPSEDEATRPAAEPTQSDESVEPAEPTEPTEPTEPAAPIEPTEPVAPTEPVEPVETTGGWSDETASAATPTTDFEEASATRSWDEPPPSDASGTEPSDVSQPAAADIESWPAQDAAQAPPEPSWSTEPPERDAAAVESWPTEPPAAGSGASDTWPTEAPARDRWEEPEPTPSEVEAYPAAAAAASVPAQPAGEPAQTVPPVESVTGESTQCPRCGTENRPGLAFCRNCGQRLVAAGVSTTVERPGTPEGTQACPRCGTHNRAGVAFCQNCGANLRGTAPGYVPPAVATTEEAAPVTERRGAVLGPVVLLIGLIGIITAYLLPFAYGSGSLFDRAMGSDGYGIAFWSGYPDVAGTLADQAYFGLAAASPILALLLIGLAVAGFMRATPGLLQVIGLVIALLWSVGLVVLFLVVEVFGNLGGDLVGMLRVLTPAGIIFFLAGLIVLIGTLTRFARS